MKAVILSGIYAQDEPDAILSTLREGLANKGFVVGDPRPGASSRGHSEASIARPTAGWCRLAVEGGEGGHAAVLSILVDSAREVVACRREPGLREFSYAHFRQGGLVESFSFGGSALGDLKFNSLHRSVPLREVVDPAVFLDRSLACLGIPQFAGHDTAGRIVFSSRNRGGWLRALLGAAWPGN